MEADVDLAKVARTDNGTNARVIVLQLRGYGSTAGSAGATNGDAAAENIDGAEWAQPLGLVSRPSLSDTTEAIILRIDDQAIAIHVIDKGGPAVTIEEGGTILHGAKERAAQIYIRAAGAIEITPKSGQDILLNGAAATATTPVAKEGSQTAGHFHTLSGTAGPYALSGTALTTTDTINAGQGTPHVKVP